jgi:flavorubredoxin
LTIPNAIREFNSKILYNSYLVLESQLAALDPSIDEMFYFSLDKITQSVFDSWVSLGHREGGTV